MKLIEVTPLDPPPELRPGPCHYIAPSHVIVGPRVPPAFLIRGDPSPDCLDLVVLSHVCVSKQHIYRFARF